MDRYNNEKMIEKKFKKVRFDCGMGQVINLANGLRIGNALSGYHG